MASMPAVRIHTYGGADVLTHEDAPRPVPGDGEVLIRVHAAAVNRIDCVVRAGYATAWFHHTLPLILGWDVSGIIEEVGPGVTDWKPGDAVYARADINRDGSYADYIVVDATHVAAKPASLDHIQAAALPHAVLTAWQLMAAGELGKGQTVLIHGAAGGVGHLAVQLAKLRGARVIGTASRNLPYLQQWGVDEAIDYMAGPFETVVRDVDVVCDTIGGDTLERSWEVIKPGGTLLSIVQQPSQEAAVAHGVRQQLVAFYEPAGKVLKEIAGLVDAGQLKPFVSTVLPLEEARKAHELAEAGHVCGKIVLRVRD